MDMLDKTAVFVFSPMNIFSAVLIEILFDIYVSRILPYCRLLYAGGAKFKETVSEVRCAYLREVTLSLCLFHACSLYVQTRFCRWRRGIYNSDGINLI